MNEVSAISGGSSPKIENVTIELREPEDLGKALAEGRALRGLTQAELARRVELHRTYLSNVEQGDAPEFVYRYFALLNELGLRLTVAEREPANAVSASN